MNTFVPSPEQSKVFEAILNGNGNIGMEALAGTGKTTTLVEAAMRLPENSGKQIFCAFNKSIVEELVERLVDTNMKAKTFHSIGYGILAGHLKSRGKSGYLKVENRKFKDIAQEVIPTSSLLRNAMNDVVLGSPKDDRSIESVQYEVTRMLVDTTRFMRLKLVKWDDHDAILRIMTEYRLYEPDFTDGIFTHSIPMAKTILERAEAQTLDEGLIDFTGMIYWGLHFGAPIPKSQWVFVDEAQDLSPMQRKMVEGCVADDGRVVFVGDPQQSLYYFAGSDSDSFQLTAETFKADIYPLTVSRRCSKIITGYAAKLVDKFTCLDDAPEGEIRWVNPIHFPSLATTGDLCLSRIKAPLISNCLNCIEVGKPATIIGTDIGESLIADIEKAIKSAKKGEDDFRWANLEEVVESYMKKQIRRWMWKEDHQMAATIEDRLAASIVLINRAAAANLGELKGFIQNLFSKTGPESMIRFSTIHKSKGLEANRVFLLAPDRLPLEHPKMTTEGKAQEKNLDYVARTRARNSFVIVATPKELAACNPPKTMPIEAIELIPDNTPLVVEPVVEEPLVLPEPKEIAEEPIIVLEPEKPIDILPPELSDENVLVEPEEPPPLPVDMLEEPPVEIDPEEVLIGSVEVQDLKATPLPSVKKKLENVMAKLAALSESEIDTMIKLLDIIKTMKEPVQIGS